ncbi:MAG: LuxR C-terminal-related transcriptional regulator [Sphingobium sp.]
MPWTLDRGLVAHSEHAIGQAREYGLGALMAAVGRPCFVEEMARHLSAIFNAEFLHISHIPARHPTKVISLSADGDGKARQQSALYLEKEIWRHDPSMAIGSQWEGTSPFLRHLDVERPETLELKHFYSSTDIGERVVVYSKASDGHLGLSIVRSARHGIFSAEERARIGILGDIAFPLLSRHFDILHEKQVSSRALTSLDIIEQCLTLCPLCLPRREIQVIARLLYGMTCEGVALDLSIAYETAVSYKKRFYRRFDLTSFRDLVVWYLALFSESSHLLPAQRFH